MSENKESYIDMKAKFNNKENKKEVKNDITKVNNNTNRILEGIRSGKLGVK